MIIECLNVQLFYGILQIPDFSKDWSTAVIIHVLFSYIIFYIYNIDFAVIGPQNLSQLEC